MLQAGKREKENKEERDKDGREKRREKREGENVLRVKRKLEGQADHRVAKAKREVDREGYEDADADVGAVREEGLDERPCRRVRHHL